MAKRLIRGTLFGAALGALAGIITAVVLYGYQIMCVDGTDVDRARDFWRFCLFLPRAIVAGVSVGALGGLVASVSPHRIPIAMAIALVATGGIAGRLASILLSRTKGEPSILPTIMGAMLGAALVFGYSIWHRRRHPPQCP